MESVLRNLFYEQLQKESDAKREVAEKRTIIVILKTDSDEDIKLIRKDLECEISCCYNWFDVKEIDEVFDWYEYL